MSFTISFQVPGSGTIKSGVKPASMSDFVVLGPLEIIVAFFNAAHSSFLLNLVSNISNNNFVPMPVRKKTISYSFFSSFFPKLVM